MSIARGRKVWLGGHDFSGVMNALGLELTLEAHDATTFDDGTRRSATGLRAVRAEHQGYFNAVAIDARLFDAVDLDGEVMTMAVAGAGEGTLAYSFPAAIAQYSPGAAVGEQLAFSVSAEASGDGADVLRGTILHNAARTASGARPARNLGAAPAGRSLYAALHVLEASGGDAAIDVSIVSGAATLAFDSAAAIGSQWKKLAGPLTGSSYRAERAIAGAAPRFRFAVIAGVV